MKIQYISDIHLEFLKYNEVKNLLNKIQSVGNVCILAGDIGNPYSENYRILLEHVNKSFKKTFLIAGNHEFYNNSIYETKQHIKEQCKAFENISFLDNSYEIYEGFRFIGSTQWTEITNPMYTINDTVKIKDFSVEKYNALYYEAEQFLKDSIGPNSIVITHHLPINDLTQKKYREGFMAKYNQWFNANLYTFIQNHNKDIKAWFYGHTHSRSVQTYYDVDFYCNPLGYPNENSYEDINMVCEISLL